MRPSLPSLVLFFLAFAAESYALGRSFKPPRPADPFADPKHDPYNPLRYIASDTLSGIAFALVLFVAFAQTFLMWRRGAKWMLAMTIGCYTYAAGFGCRFGLHVHPEDSNLYIAEYLLIVLSPCAFIAADYVLLGRLARHLGCDKHMLVSPRRITLVFVSSDITTFLIQATGGSLSISVSHPSVALLGSHIFLAGLALQLASFLLFTCVYALFMWRVRTLEPEIWDAENVAGVAWYRRWKTLACALSLSCVGILIRSVYRTIELSQGYVGHLATTESFFYGLDTLPLIIAIIVYVPFWPGRFIPAGPAAAGVGVVDEKGDTASAPKSSNPTVEQTA